MVRVRVVMAAALAGLAAVAAACAGGRVNPAAVQVAITGDEQQRIDGWGVAVVNDDPGEPLLRPGVPPADVALMDRLVFRDGGINLVRVFTPGWGSERAAGRVGPPVASDARWAFMRRVRKYGVRFMLTGGDAPASMLSARVPASRLVLGKPLAAGQEKAYARYLASILTFANRIAVPFDSAAV